MKTLMHVLFRIVWRRRLAGLRLVRVTGWRSCLVDTEWGQRQRTTFLFSTAKEA
jgi:hypothetical protein